MARKLNQLQLILISRSPRFFRWSQSVPLEGKNSINKPFYLSLANYAYPTSSFLKLKAANVLLTPRTMDYPKRF